MIVDRFNWRGIVAFVVAVPVIFGFGVASASVAQTSGSASSAGSSSSANAGAAAAGAKPAPGASAGSAGAAAKPGEKKEDEDELVCLDGTKRVDFSHVDLTGRPAYVPDYYNRLAFIRQGANNTRSGNAVRVEFDRTTGMAAACLTAGPHTYAPSGVPGVDQIDFSRFDSDKAHFAFVVSQDGRVTLGAGATTTTGSTSSVGTGTVSVPDQTVSVVTGSTSKPDVVKIVDDAVAVTFVGKHEDAVSDPLFANLLDGVQFDLQNAAGTQDTKTRHGRTVYMRFGSYAIAALRGEPLYLPTALKFVVGPSDTGNFVKISGDTTSAGSVSNPATISLNLQLAPAGGAPSVLKPSFVPQGQPATTTLKPPVLLAQNTRYATAVRVAEEAYAKGSVKTIFVASGESFPDALAAGPAAKAAGAPLLLTLPNSLPSVVADAIKGFGAQSVVVVGGESAVSAKVVKEIEGLGLSVSRISGADRIATASALAAKYFPDVKTAFVAYGWDYPDALSASSVGALNGWPVLLSSGSAGWTLASVGSKYERNILVGGKTRLADPADLNDRVSRVSGADRFATSLLVARLASRGLQVQGLAAAHGNSFPDALVASQLANKGVVVLLAHDKLTPAQSAYLRIVKTRSDLVRYVVGVLAFGSPHILD